jgi:hypothetical protein
MVGWSFDGRRLGVSLAVFALACGPGGSLDGGFIGVPWKSRAAAPPPYADSATTTALATGGSGASASKAKSKRKNAPNATRGQGSVALAADPATTAAPAVTSGRLESTLIRLRDLERRQHRLTGAYSAHPGRLGLPIDPGVQLRVVWASPWGWAALARDSANTMPACAIYVGTVPSSLALDGRVGSARAGAPVCVDSGEQPSRMLIQVQHLADDPPAADQAMMGLMRADLMNLATSQRQYRGVQGTYSRATRVLNIHYSWSSGVALTILSADSKGWSGEATYEQLPGKSCVIYAGKVTELPATEQLRLVPPKEGSVVCDK